MSRSDHPITLMLLVDALRPDYLTHAPYLRRLAERSATGALRECFGFVPRQAYFGGLSAEEYGFTNMFCFDPDNSPFRMARCFPAEAGAEVRRELSGARRMVDERAKEQLSYFAKNYGTSVEIPLPYAPYFDLVERRAPWDPQVGYRSCFAILDELRIPWMQWMWPDTNKLRDRSDRGIVEQVLKDLTPQHQLLCVHLQELDGLGHAFGPNSAQLQKGVAQTDELVARLVDTLRERFREVKIVLFGDHGMVNVTRTLDVARVLEGTKLRFGVDYAYFLDSTMARLWFFHADARATVEAALRPLGGGRWLDAEDMKHYGIAGCDRRNAEAVFLADPGVLIFPNFFQASGKPIPGMHGYDPDCADNLGFFLLHDESRPELPGNALGKVDPPTIFPLLLRCLGLEPARFTKVPVPQAKPAAETKNRYTLDPSPAADAMVQNHLDRILAALKNTVGEVEAVVLTGSFGRGEGGVFRDAAGQLQPVNDYDLIVVDRRNLGNSLHTLGRSIARELEIDFVDMSQSDGVWANMPLTIFNYDLKYGSQVIAGDRAVLDRLPAYASASIPVYELLRLLLNRTGGLLSGLRGEFLDGSNPAPDAQRYLTNQVVKAYLALGDWYLWKWQGYDSSYAKRRERFNALARGAQLSPDLVAKIDQAYALKCRPDYGCFARGYADVAELFPFLAEALVASAETLTGRPCKTLGAAMTNYVFYASPDTPAVKAENERGLQQLIAKGIERGPGSSERALRHSIQAVLPLALEAAQLELGMPGLRQAREFLGSWMRLPASADSPARDWERLRALTVEAWFTICH